MKTAFVKPPGLTPEYGAQFQDPTIVRAYRHREPYPAETFEILRGLAGALTPSVLDLGCGPGDLSVGLSRFAGKVDAVDLSLEMINEARRAHSEISNINWICHPAETSPVHGPFDLITAADSLHWMDWQVLFPNLRKWLKPGGFFCVVGRWYEKRDWWDGDFQSLIDTYSTNKDFKKYDILEELKKSGFVNIEGSTHTKPVSFTQPVNELIEAFHSRNGFSRDRMGANAELFDQEAKILLSRFASNGQLQLHSSSFVAWMTICEPT